MFRMSIQHRQHKYLYLLLIVIEPNALDFNAHLQHSLSMQYHQFCVFKVIKYCSIMGVVYSSMQGVLVEFYHLIIVRPLVLNFYIDVMHLREQEFLDLKIEYFH